MTRDFLQTRVYAEWGAMCLVVWAKSEGQLANVLERAKEGEGEFRVEDLEQAAMNATLMTEEETKKVLYFVVTVREHSQRMANRGANPRTGKR